MKYTEVFHVGACDIDINGYLKADAVLRFIQEIAGCQHEAHGPLIEDLRRDNMAFVLSRISLDVFDIKGLSGKKVYVTTWLKSLRGFIFERNTVITKGSEAGELIAQSSALWGLIDLRERKPLRAGTIAPGFSQLDEPLTLISPVRVVIDSSTELNQICKHKVAFGECDENRHLNNTVYAGIFRDLVPNSENLRVSGLSVSYLSEALIGEEFDVLGGEMPSDTDDSVRYAFKTILSNGNVGAESIITLQKLKN